jgi:hypothetical protein
MKKIFSLIILSFLVVSMAGAVSSCNTVVGGLIYNEDYSAVIGGADVTVSCNGNIETTVSAVDGAYGVEFLSDECTSGDLVVIDAVKGDLVGSENGIVHDFELEVRVAIVNVPMVPEFGFFVGALAILSGVGIFFFVRRE